MISAVIFDVDGTLLNTETIYMEAWRQAAKQKGFTMNEEYLQKSRARNIQDTLLLFNEYFGARISFYELRDLRVKLAEEMISAKTPGELLMPGVPGTLDFLEKHGIKTALATSTERNKSDDHLRAAGLFGRFPVTVTGDEVKHGKPDPEAFLTAAAKLGVKPEECLVAEDSPAGIEAASRAGMTPVFIPDMAKPTEDTYRRAAAVLGSLAELPALIEKKNAPEKPVSGRQKLLLISMDAMMTTDLAQAFQYGSYRSLKERGALVEHVRTLFPAMTYPCHTTMISGCLPHKSGVWNNYAQLPGQHKWNWFHDPVKCPDLMSAAKAAGLTTASVSWPVTGNHPDVDYLVDEIWPEDPNAAPKDLHRIFLNAGTPEEVYQSCIGDERAALRLQRKQPETSWFSTGTAADILKKYAPDVMTLHLTAIDTFRHKYGADSAEARESVAYTADMLKQLLRTLEESGALENTNVVVTSDHGQFDVDRIASPNVLLRKAGLITLKEDGSLKDWKAWCFEAGCSAIVALKDPADKETEKAVYTLFAAQFGGDPGYTKIWTEAEAEKAEGLGGDFAFVLQGDDHTEFDEKYDGDTYFTPKKGGMHGHFPDLAPDPFLLAAGPAFKKGAVLEKARIEDVAPTCAAALGLTLPDAEGRILTEILRG